MIKVLIGDMFASQMKTLVNTVNCVGIMGKGIAAIFKKQYPDMFEEYKYRCERDLVKLGEPYHYSNLTGDSIVNFPTKGHWRASTRLSDVEAGLDHLIAHYKEWGINSIAFPPLGCGNGGLDWKIVGPLMVSKLRKLEIPIEIYAPFGTPAQYLKPAFLESAHQLEFMVKGKRREKLKAEWAALVEIIFELQQQPHANPIGRTIFQKICYIITKMGVDTGFEFKKSSYGPFSSEVQEAISVLANNNWIIEEQLGKMTAIRIGPEYSKFRAKAANDLRPFEKKISKTVDLFSRIKSTDQAEEVTTVIYAVQSLKEAKGPDRVSEQDIFNYIVDWKKKWSSDDKKKSDVADTIRNLQMLGWIKANYSESLVQQN